LPDSGAFALRQSLLYESNKIPAHGICSQKRHCRVGGDPTGTKRRTSFGLNEGIGLKSPKDNALERRRGDEVVEISGIQFYSISLAVPPQKRKR
jgi:hypothetical protein